MVWEWVMWSQNIQNILKQRVNEVGWDVAGEAWKKRKFRRGETEFFSPELKGPNFASETWEVIPGFPSLSPHLALESNSHVTIPDPRPVTSVTHLTT